MQKEHVDVLKHPVFFFTFLHFTAYAIRRKDVAKCVALQDGLAFKRI